MLTEDVFLAKLLETPTDDTTRLVYADWLDEQGDPESAAKAEFLRLTVQLPSSKLRKGQKKALRKQLQQRAAPLDTDWLAVVSRLPIERCYRKRTEGEEIRLGFAGGVTFDFLCDRRWEELNPTDDRAVRFCDTCQQHVHYCDTIMEARRHAWDGHCIAVDLGVIRRERDLEPQRLPALGMLDMPEPSNYRREQERLEPDAVSAERERRKREKDKGKETPLGGGA
jgi:uncharacterized protein (TIGR02996 family)